MSTRFALAESPSGVGIVAPVDYILISNGDGTWNVAPAASSGAVDSVFARTGNVVAEDNDYNSGQVSDDSTAGGATVKASLTLLKTGVTAAQTSANTGITNAAAAQTSANTGITNAAAAQASATTAIANAAAAQTSANTGITNAATADAKAVAAQQPFVGAYYVNSAFAGTALGSQSNPFTTVAAAFAFAASVGVANGVVYLNKSHTENVVFPVTGNWELAALNDAGQSTVTLTGTIDVSCTTAGRRSLSNLTITGAVSGNTPTGATASRFRATNCFFFSTLTLTASGTGLWRCQLAGPVPGGLSGSGGFVGAVSINGSLASSYFEYDALVTLTGAAAVHHLFNCFLTSGLTLSQTGNDVRLYNQCDYNAGVAFTSSAGSQTLTFDGSSYYTLLGASPTFSGTIVLKTANANRSNRSTIAGNLGSTALTTVVAPGQYTMTATLTLLVAGTLGTAVVNAIYTDLLGVVQTKPIGAGLNIAGAAGSEFSAKLTFATNGAAIAYSVTGITTPGTLSLSTAVNVRAEF